MTQKTQAKSAGIFTTSRTLNATRDKVWKAYTDAAELKKWFGPKGFAMSEARMDLRAGGMFHYCLQAPDGTPMWGKWVFNEIDAPKKITVVTTFSDKDGNTMRHPFAADWPLETIGTTLFTEQNGKTTLTVEWEPLNPTQAEQAIFDAAHTGMTQGWAGTFDQLEEYLAE